MCKKPLTTDAVAHTIRAMHPAEAIAKLIESGLTEVAIGELVGVNQSTINRIRHGQVPAWPVGKALIDAAVSRKKARSTKQKAA